MTERIYRDLRPVVRRQRAALMLRAMLVGCLAASIAAIYLGVMRLIGRHVSPSVVAGVLAGGPLLGLAIGATAGWGWRRAARAVDAHYGLKDRSLTALAFLPVSAGDPVRELQIRDAERRLAGVSAREVVPFRWPKILPYAVVLFGASIAILALPPFGGKTVEAAAKDVLPEAARTEEMVRDYHRDAEKLAKDNNDKDLADLVKQLDEKLAEIKEPGLDPKEFLAKISEMQAAIAQKQAEYNVGLVDAQLQALGQAMLAATSTEAAGKALQDGKFDQAARELEKLEDPPLEKKETKSLAEKLKQVAKSMGDVGLGQMSGAVGELADGVRESNNAKFKKATRTLAGLSKSQAARKKIKEILDAELLTLSECKECNSEIALRALHREKSNKPSTNWGATTSGNTFGDKTKLQSKRDLKEITGVEGEGASEMETSHSPEGKQAAARGLKESYQKYKKMSEAVLDSEPIPLGHRQAIRKYFQLIRPPGGGSPQPAAADKGK